MKAIVLVIDGLADRPVASLEGRTPLEKAEKPNLNALAQMGITGVSDAISPGIRAGSDTSHLAILGYNPMEVYTGRGPFEAAGLGMDIKPGEVAWRCNFATVDDDLTVIDRRAGRIEDTEELAQAINENVNLEVEFEFKSWRYRGALVFKDEGLSYRVTDTDPHATGVKVEKPRALESEAEKTAKLLWDFTLKAHEVLKNHPLNKGRELPANFLLARGAGVTPELENFEAKYGLSSFCMATTAIIRGIAKLAGMEVVEPEEKYADRIKQALELLKTRDFALINIKEADEAGHDNKPDKKVEIIEQIDQAIEPLLEFARENYVVVLADHSTPCSVGDHAGDTVPVVIAGPEVRKDRVEKFDEINCSYGALGRIRHRDIMPILLDLLNKAEKFGA